MPWGFIIRGTQSYWLALSLYPGDVSIKLWQVFVKSSSSVLWQGWLESFVPIVENVDMVGIEFENMPSSRVSDPFCMLSNPTSCWGTLSTRGFWTNCQYRKKPHLTYFICCVCVHKSACVSAHTHAYTCHAVHVEVKGQFSEVGSFIPFWGPSSDYPGLAAGTSTHWVSSLGLPLLKGN